jgi:hypothetical protein
MPMRDQKRTRDAERRCARTAGEEAATAEPW